MPDTLGNPIEAWKARGRELNELYDAIVKVVDEPAQGLDPVADLLALGAQRDRYREALRVLTQPGLGTVENMRSIAADALALRQEERTHGD